MNALLAVGLVIVGGISAGLVLRWVIDRLIDRAPVQLGEYSRLDRLDGRRHVG